MIIIFEDLHKEHLLLLEGLPIEAIHEVCKAVVAFIENGPNPKLSQGVAQQMELDAKLVQHAMDGITHLLTESSKLMLSDVDFHDSLSPLGFSEEIIKELRTHYSENKSIIRKNLVEMMLNLPKYVDMEWRLEIQLASRALRHQSEPVLLLKFYTTSNDKTETTVLRTDPVNLLHLTTTLEEALKEMKSSHCRRIVRNI